MSNQTHRLRSCQCCRDRDVQPRLIVDQNKKCSTVKPSFSSAENINDPFFADRQFLMSTSQGCVAQALTLPKQLKHTNDSQNANAKIVLVHTDHRGSYTRNLLCSPNMQLHADSIGALTGYVIMHHASSLLCRLICAYFVKPRENPFFSFVNVASNSKLLFVGDPCTQSAVYSS